MELCDLEYTTNNKGVTSVTRCIPHQGVSLFEIKATYAKTVPSATYYVLGDTKKMAKGRFENTMTWLTITSIRLIPPGEEAESILTDPMRMPLR